MRNGEFSPLVPIRLAYGFAGYVYGWTQGPGVKDRFSIRLETLLPVCVKLGLNGWADRLPWTA